ncbi:uncharacterized protein [Littorina saxatilis]|uniref:uncharacterized protein n=1 Tax=Littorina saxatilis TaxID=31220 RepID=UPI0038B4AFD7
MKGSEDVSRSVPALSGGSYRAASSGSWESTSPECSSTADHSNSGSTAAAEAGVSFGFGDTRYTDVRRPSAATRLDSIGEDEVFESSAAVYAVQTNVNSRVAARCVLGSTGRSLSKDSSSSSLGYSLGSEFSECAYSPTSPTAVSNVSAIQNEIAADNADRFIKPLPGYNSNSNTLSSSTTPRSTSSGYGTASSKLSASSESSPGGDGSGSLSKELDLELVRLEILVDSLQEMEEELNFNEQQKINEKEEGEEGGAGECDVWEYQSSEYGDLLSSANEGELKETT